MKGLRIRNNRLYVETGSWSTSVSYNELYCKCCQSDCIEDEYHFVLESQFYKELRRKNISRFFIIGDQVCKNLWKRCQLEILSVHWEIRLRRPVGIASRPFGTSQYFRPLTSGLACLASFWSVSAVNRARFQPSALPLISLPLKQTDAPSRAQGQAAWR